VAALPFLPRACPVVTCVDVLEHLPPAVRLRAVEEMVRVADRAVLIACPHGATARECDEGYRQACVARGRPLPAWLLEHQQQPYPETAQLVEHLEGAARAGGRSARISVTYSERADVCRWVRAAAARSDLLYLFFNLLFGMAFDVLPAPAADSSYRAVILAELS
jgi:hypothetical protein